MDTSVTILTPEKAAATYARPDSGIDSVVAKLDMRTPLPVVFASCGDSTINALEEAYALAFRELMAELYPERAVDYVPLNAAGTAAGTPVAWQAGAAATAETATVFRDGFNRAGDLKGSAPDVGRSGAVWEGVTTGYGATDGGKLVTTNASPGFYGYVFTLARASTDFALAPTSFTVSTVTVSSGNKASRITPVYLNSSNFISIAHDTSAVVTTYVIIAAGGASRNVVFPSGTVPAQQASATVNVSALKLVGSTLTATVNGATVSTELSSAELAAVATMDKVFVSSSDAAFTLDVLEVTGKVQPSGGAALPKVTVYNAAVPGSRPAHHIDRLAAVYVEKPDFLLFCHGHNARVAVDEWIAEALSFLDPFSKFSPNTRIGVMTQNPRFSPADRIKEHAEQMLALRALARRRGWTVFDTYSAMARAADGGKSLTSFDATTDPPAGIHPTHPSDGVSGGSRVQANEIKRVWKAASSRA
ncbi:SGNH/GDSL hydrolase family protein [Clavibacter zhangzhiyongii]|uniref:SGNH/GDSL hydrolase family protein n=1 Tax=Clavibacter zhangzhiyongii TaxID=2768071 RepID=UPI0039E1C547